MPSSSAVLSAPLLHLAVSTGLCSVWPAAGLWSAPSMHAAKKQRRASSASARAPGSFMSTTAQAGERSEPELPLRRWLLKSEPSDYSIDQMETDGRTVWDGVRSAAARKHMRAMRTGERALFYHSSCGNAVGVVGEVEVVRAAYPDPADEAWAVVDVQFVERWARRVSLAEIKARAAELSGLALLSQARLSVQPVSEKHYAIIKDMRRKDE